MYREDEIVQNAQAETGISLQQSLAAFIAKVYWWMAFALAVTGLCAWGVGTSQQLLQAIFGSKFVLIALVVAEVGLVISISGFIQKMSASTGTALFIAYAALNGATLAWIFVAFTTASIASAFVMTAGLFGVMALYGTITKRDLTSLGNILFMALIGVVIAMLVNIFLKSSMMQLVLSILCMIVFTGLTAYDAQKVKAMFLDTDDSSETRQKIAVLGALALYLDFINLFITILQLFGNRRD